LDVDPTLDSCFDAGWKHVTRSHSEMAIIVGAVREPKIVATKPAVLIVDDDPSHLKLYSLLLENDGFLAVPLLVKTAPIVLPESTFDVAVVDYKLGLVRAVDVVLTIQRVSPNAPILLLTDMAWMPDDVKPFLSAFVRKGEPEQLISSLRQLTTRQTA